MRRVRGFHISWHLRVAAFTGGGEKNKETKTKLHRRGQKQVILYDPRRSPRGGCGHAGFDSDLPGPQKPQETINTKEKHTSIAHKSQNFFLGGPVYGVLYRGSM